MRLITVLVALLTLVPATTLAAGSTTLAAEPLTNAQIIERGRALTDQFYKVDLDPVWAACSQDLKTALGGLEAFRSYRLNGVQTYGRELKLYNEEVLEQNGLKFYVRAASFEKRPELVWYVVWGLNPETGVVEYFTIEFAGRAPA